MGGLLGLSVSALASTTILGALEHPDNFDLGSKPGYVDYSIDLESWEYEVRLPANFDANKTYGLITHIDSGPGGLMPAVWQPVLAEHDLIWLAGKNIGNSISSYTRRGVALLGAYRMTELYNIDPRRIIGSGNSGGSRAVASLVILHPDEFAGVINNVGSTFAHDLPEKFTDPTSTYFGHYEYDAITSYPTNGYWDDTRHFDSSTRWVTLTAYTDFREDELMNIYHLGHINFGNTAKLISRDGGHGYKEYQDYNDAINFIEHPLIHAIEDTFDADIPDAGTGFVDLSKVGASIYESAYSFNGKSLSSLKLDAGSSEALAEASEQFAWNTPYGIILDTRLRTEDTGLYNQQMGLHILKVNTDDSTRTGFNLLVQQISHTEKHVQFILTDANGTDTVLFEFDLDAADEPLDRLASDASYFGRSEAPDYVGKSEAFRGLDVRMQLWDQAIQFTFGQDIDAVSFVSTETPTAVRLMDDHRIVQLYFDEVGITADVQALVGDEDRWKLWLSNQALESAPADAALFDDLTLTVSRVATNKELKTLMIHSGNGVSAPPGRINPFDPGTVVTCKVESVISGNNLLIPTGWVLSGNEPASGSTNEFVMTITNNAVLAWQWATNTLVRGISMDTNAVADAYTQTGNPAAFGFDPVVRISNHSNEQGFLKFAVDGNLDWDFVDSVALRVRAAGDISNTTVYAVGDTTWQEGTISGVNEPALGAVLDTSVRIAAGDWHEFDVSSHIRSNGIWALGMRELDPHATSLYNGDFERPDGAVGASLTAGGWSLQGVANQVIHAAGYTAESGDQGVWMKAWSANQNGTFYQEIPTFSGQALALSASFKLEPNFEGNGSQIEMELVWLDASATEISRAILDVDAAVSTTGTWEPLNLEGIAPEGAAQVRAQIHWTTDGTIENTTSASAMLDNMALTATATNAYEWYSRESGFAPQLIIRSWILADADSDEDGMRDGWEVQHFGGLFMADGLGDSDGDTFIDLHEFVAGTDPRSDRSYLRMEGANALGGNQYELSWASVDGIHYRVLYSTQLMNPIWKTHQAGIVGTAPLNVVTSSVESTTGYFVVEVE